jgi:hypothetical protein
VTNGTLAESEKPYIRTSSISTQTISRNESLYRDRPLRNWKDYISSGDPAFEFHSAHLSDATILTLTFAHILMDASGSAEVIKALILVLDEGPIPPLLAHDPWPILLPDALRAPNDPEAIRGWAIWDSATSTEMGRAEKADFEADGQNQQRTVYFPAAEIQRLKNQALAELRRAGHDVPFLSTNDVVAAWLYKASQMFFVQDSVAQFDAHIAHVY